MEFGRQHGTFEANTDTNVEFPANKASSPMCWTFTERIMNNNPALVNLDALGHLEHKIAFWIGTF